jgi:hypothetical protein
MKKKMVFVLLTFLVAGCVGADAGKGPAENKKYKLIQVDNPEYRPNTRFLKQEDITSERFKEILRLYKLDQLIAAEKDEFKQMLMLRNWLREHIVTDKSKPAVGEETLAYLREGPKGGHYHCGHFSTAQTAVMNAVGFVSRRILCGPGGQGPRNSGIHGATEIWCNSLCKWVMFDAEWDTHFEKDGVPLSALEIRDEVQADGAKKVLRVQGIERKAIPFYEDGGYGGSPITYNWVSWWLEQNGHTIWPKKQQSSSIEVLYNDDYCRDNLWYRSGRKHWAYDAGFFQFEDSRKVIEWTPNVLKVDAVISGDVMKVQIVSSTPNLKGYRMRQEGGKWRDIDDKFELKLSGDGGRWQLQSVNLMGVCGPVYRLAVGLE